MSDNANCFLIQLSCWSSIPPFVLAVVGTASSDRGVKKAFLQAQILRELIAFLTEALKLRVIGYGCDGAGQATQSALVTVPIWKEHFILPPLVDLESPNNKAKLATCFLTARGQSLPCQRLVLPSLEGMPVLVFTDMIHLLPRTFHVLRNGISLGSEVFQLEAVFGPLVDRLPRELLKRDFGLRRSDIFDPIMDKMNASRPERVILHFFEPENMAKFLDRVGATPEERELVKKFLYVAEIARLTILALLSPTLTVRQRVEAIYRASVRATLWTNDREQRTCKTTGKEKVFVRDLPLYSSVTLTGIQRNSNSLIALVAYIIRNKLHAILPIYSWLLGSQACEDLFRALRYLGGSASGMSLQEMLWRMQHIIEGHIMGVSFRPSNPKRTKTYDSLNRDYVPPKECAFLPSETTEKDLIAWCKAVATEEICNFQPYSVKQATSPASKKRGNLVCHLGNHRFSANKKTQHLILHCKVCSHSSCSPCTRLSEAAYAELAANPSHHWMCSICVDAEVDKQAREDAREEVVQQIHDAVERQPRFNCTPHFKVGSVADLTQVSTEITLLTAQVFQEVKTRVGALDRIPVSQYMLPDVLMRMRYPHLLWATLQPIPMNRRSNYITLQSRSGSTTMLISSWLSAVLPYLRESSERTQRVIRRDNKQMKADLNIDEDDADNDDDSGADDPLPAGQANDENPGNLEQAENLAQAVAEDPSAKRPLPTDADADQEPPAQRQRTEEAIPEVVLADMPWDPLWVDLLMFSLESK